MSVRSAPAEHECKSANEIAHTHRVLVFRGAARKTHEAMEARALELATRFGHSSERLRVLRTDHFEAGVPQKVNLENAQARPSTGAIASVDFEKRQLVLMRPATAQSWISGASPVAGLRITGGSGSTSPSGLAKLS